ncbi:hypothetical protein APR64_09095 [Enterobacter hormaechei]|uniref:hypothetical protein n=1 Tax=Enterobacter hormaechei TaxID=158836 RepID=UPI00073F1AC2|nr:hypothetical protein [Enterobacter hormaechei]MCU3648381.1 hypothetical protein [Enterobacter hormaechei subsp. xiangfangensis]KUH53012.1 hypothetical protein APR64_09095 [Enterobacter hormaechei]MCO6617488.1 hypothetical protein [Enterobacter hormaechei]MDX7053319.1 hypothetical protein [Enterobacter hormaechei]PZA27836.1 hypothetical protein C7B73_02080 [Enterobacter hormaechei]
MVIDFATVIALLTAVGALVGWVWKEFQTKTQQNIILENRISRIERDISINEVKRDFVNSFVKDLKSDLKESKSEMRKLEDKIREMKADR